MKNFRLAAAGIIIDKNKILLVRYKDKNGQTLLVGPGGGIMPEEDLIAGLKREVFEETGLSVQPSRMLFVEDLLSSKHRMIKIWFFCSIVEGVITQTEEARIEGIIDVNWYTKSQLEYETVYPEILKAIDWLEFYSQTFETRYFTLKKANF